MWTPYWSFYKLCHVQFILVHCPCSLLSEHLSIIEPAKSRISRSLRPRLEFRSKSKFCKSSKDVLCSLSFNVCGASPGPFLMQIYIFLYRHIANTRIRSSLVLHVLHFLILWNVTAIGYDHWIPFLIVFSTLISEHEVVSRRRGFKISFIATCNSLSFNIRPFLTGQDGRSSYSCRIDSSVDCVASPVLSCSSLCLIT